MSDILKDYKEIRMIENIKNAKNYLKQIKDLEKENEELKKELQRYKDMKAKGLEEFKFVGGCWSCGIQLSADKYIAKASKYHQALEEIREVCNKYFSLRYPVSCIPPLAEIENKINKVLESEEE